LAETTVTQALWQVVMFNNPGHFQGENRPVEQISWKDTYAFIDKLNQLHRALQVRLPWEAEWEYACRAGTDTPFNFAGNLTLDKVNYRGTSKYKADKWGEGAKQATADVKTYPCNNWGLFEMHGNVYEWCEDVWQDVLGNDPVLDPWKAGEATGAARRVIRGGSWRNSGGVVRSAARFRETHDFRHFSLGFRLALGHAEPS
jgi:formylglycine-generating enzyme